MSDHDWQPRAGLDVARSRAGMLRRARDFFDARGVLEVDTPALTRHPVSDPHIESMSVGGETAPALFLHTSPEYRMKQLLAAGFGDIYQVCKVFRGGERGPQHLPEFTLLEWYRLNYGLGDMMKETVEFLATLLERPGLVTTARYAKYSDLFRNTVQLDPEMAGVSDLAGCLSTDARLENAIGDDRNAWLDLVMAEKVVPEFAQDGITVVFHYPASQAALARICPDDGTVADRFEVFFGAVELANGFVELTDADEQSSRFDADQELRRRRKQAVHPLDQHLLDALRAGLPPCAGVAAGFERLLMLHEGQSDIAAISNFVL